MGGWLSAKKTEGQVEQGYSASFVALEVIIADCVHKAVLHPWHTWPKPLWVLTTGSKLYIASALGLSEAIALVKVQSPQETETLEVVTVGGVVAPNMVISLERASACHQQCGNKH